jgi:hypothetical protein
MAGPSIDLFGLRAVTAARAPLTLLLMLLAVDAMYFVSHLRATRTEFESSLSFVDVEYGYPEAFQSLQWLWCLGLVALLAVLARRWAFLGLLPLLLFFLLTDRYSLHERGGAALVAALDLPGLLGLRPQDTGELLVLAGAALVVVPCAVLGLRLATLPDRTDIARALAVCVLIALAGVVLDGVHILVIEQPETGDPFGLVEDGAEMLAATVLVAHLYRVWLDAPTRPLLADARRRWADRRSTMVT